MGPPVAAGCGRNSEHPVLRFVPGDPGLRAPCAETHSLPPPERPARRPAPLGIGLASLSRTPRSWWPSPRLDGRLEVCPSQRHGLGTLIRPGAETRSSRPCSGPALLPDSVSPARRRDLLVAPPGAVHDDLGTLPAGPLPDHEPSHRRRYGPSAEVQNVTVGAAHSGIAGRGTCRSTGRACW